MANIIPFLFGTHEIRIHVDEKGAPWWEAQNVCTALEIRDTSKAVARLRSREKRSVGRNLLIINESGLYRLIMRSNKPEAEKFQDWVCEEVIPSIRKTGKYEVEPALNRFPELRAIVELAQSTAEARVLAEEAKAEAEIAKATALAADARAERVEQQQAYWTVAEYAYHNHLQSQLPESAYKTCSDHLRLYCMDHNIPFRKQAVGGKKWADEYAFHVSVYAEVLPEWLKRRYAQATLHVIHTS
jgi:prophage antirepressor-like protein